jgi:hypothetical protein
MERHHGHTLPKCPGGGAQPRLGYDPAFRTLGLDTARTREVNTFVHALYLARSEAIKRNGVVSLCPSRDGDLCAAAGTPWHSGWIVFVNRDRDQPAVRDPDEDLLHVYSGWAAGSVFANGPPSLPAVRTVGNDGHVHLLRPPRRSIRARREGVRSSGTPPLRVSWFARQQALRSSSL